ncbi:MAG: GNAT family N-acetyltransferase [Saprospiraceae bacterium]
MDNILIRQAEEKDLAAILDLVRDLAIYEKAEDQLTATLEDYKKNFKEGVFEAIVAEQEGKVVGMALYYLTWSTWRGRMLYLEDFVVKEHLRGAGFGNKLTLRCKESSGFGLLSMKWQVLDWNTRQNFL